MTNLNDFPKIEGRYILDAHWSIEFPIPMRRKAHSDHVSFWCKNLEFTMAQWENQIAQSPKEWIYSIKSSFKEDFQIKSYDIGYLYCMYFFEHIENNNLPYIFNYWIASDTNLLYVKVHAATKDLCTYAKQICQTIEQPVIEVFRH